jgi:hypothetical protein
VAAESDAPRCDARIAGESNPLAHASRPRTVADLATRLRIHRLRPAVQGGDSTSGARPDDSAVAVEPSAVVAWSTCVRPRVGSDEGRKTRLIPFRIASAAADLLAGSGFDPTWPAAIAKAGGLSLPAWQFHENPGWTSKKPVSKQVGFSRETMANSVNGGRGKRMPVHARPLATHCRSHPARPPSM